MENIIEDIVHKVEGGAKDAKQTIEDDAKYDFAYELAATLISRMATLRANKAAGCLAALDALKNA